MNKIDQENNADPNKNYCILENIIVNSINLHLPLKKLKFNKHKHKRSKWVTNGIIKSITFRDNLYKQYKSTDPNTHQYLVLKQNLKTYNSLLKKLIRNAKKHYYCNEFQKYKQNTGKTWNVINSIIHKTSSNKSPDSIQVNNKFIHDTKAIAEHFNTYFANIGPNMAANIDNNITHTYQHYLVNKHNMTFEFTSVNETDIHTIIRNLGSKNSAGYDGLSSKLLKALAPVLIKPITLLINQSLRSGTFPDKLKMGKIIPIYKKDDPQKIENYRPISILPSLSKIFEKSSLNNYTHIFQPIIFFILVSMVSENSIQLNIVQLN